MHGPQEISATEVGGRTTAQRGRTSDDIGCSYRGPQARGSFCENLSRIAAATVCGQQAERRAGPRWREARPRRRLRRRSPGHKSCHEVAQGTSKKAHGPTAGSGPLAKHTAKPRCYRRLGGRLATPARRVEFRDNSVGIQHGFPFLSGNASSEGRVPRPRPAPGRRAAAWHLATPARRVEFRDR
jgi:hypothetical protein